jgi:hypothetical protein
LILGGFSAKIYFQNSQKNKNFGNFRVVSIERHPRRVRNFTGRGVLMIQKLSDVKERADLTALYLLNGLSTHQEKIDFLARELKKLGSRSEFPETPEQELRGLEEFVLFFPGFCGD